MAVALALPAEMAQAHEAWRNNLAATSLAEIIAACPSAPARTRLRLTGTP